MDSTSKGDRKGQNDRPCCFVALNGTVDMMLEISGTANGNFCKKQMKK